MKMLEVLNRRLAVNLIKDFDETGDKRVRVRYGLVAGWVSICAMAVLFVVKMALGLMAGSISVIANAFYLLSHLANSVVLVVSFAVSARPATAKTPFGHGRMEHIAPLVMAVFLFVAGIQLGERAVHQTLDPHAVHYWAALPWILLATIAVKQWLASFIRFLGERIHSRAILVNAAHQRVESVMSAAVIGGLVAGHHYRHPEIDGYIGILVSVWLLYLGYSHGREAIVPLLGQAPERNVIEKIRETAKSVDGVEDVHEIILHDYGSMYLISLHAEIRERRGPAAMHEIAERCEGRLRKEFGGEVIVHTDPIVEKTPEIRAVERSFSGILRQFPRITGYHDFRVVAESSEKIIVLADLDAKEEVPETDFARIENDIEALVKAGIPNVAYCSFYITPKFAY